MKMIVPLLLRCSSSLIYRTTMQLTPRFTTLAVVCRMLHGKKSNHPTFRGPSLSIVGTDTIPVLLPRPVYPFSIYTSKQHVHYRPPPKGPITSITNDA
jgi:hypothetical protein